jgi:hypothetical protein
VLADWRSSPVAGKLRATIGFLEKLTLTPEEVRQTDIAYLREVGVSERAIIDAIYVCTGFNVIVRIADALEFTVPPPVVFDRASRYLLLFGYKLLSGKFFGMAPASSSSAKAHLTSSPNNGQLNDPYAEGIRLLKMAILNSPGTLSSDIRAKAMYSDTLPGLVGEYLRLVGERAWGITSDDLEALKKAGNTEDQIFELTICAAVGAGLARLEKGLQVLHQATQQR